jgi:hypothetical protein
MMKQALYRAMIGAAAVVVLSLPAAATGAPREVGVDRSDNRVAISYEADSGAIGSQSTSTQAGINPDVSFQVTVDEAEGTGPGLLGKITLRLDTDRAQTYDGWFALHVEDDNGGTVFHRTRPRYVRLRPEPGYRRISLRYTFDLPTGDYKVSGTFQSS